MTKFDHGGGCACGLYRECCCEQKKVDFRKLTRTSYNHGLTPLEQEFLLDCAGFDTTIKGWGSWMMTAAAALKKEGFMKESRGSFSITPDGTAVANQIMKELRE